MIRLKEIRKRKGVYQKDVAQFMNVAKSTYSYWESGSSEPSYEALEKLASYFGVTVGYLMGVDDRPSKKGFKIPVLGVIPAGTPIEAIEDILDYEEIDQKLASTGEFFALKVQGDSMAPQLLPGDIIIVRQQETAENEDTVIIIVNGNDATIKRIKKEPSGVTLLPNNPAYTPTYYSNHEIETLPVKIIGKAIEIRRGL